MISLEINPSSKCYLVNIKMKDEAILVDSWE